MLDGLFIETKVGAEGAAGANADGAGTDTEDGDAETERGVTDTGFGAGVAGMYDGMTGSGAFSTIPVAMLSGI